MEWRISYINIQGWMIYNLKLSWNELLLFALIFWYTQDYKNEYHWSLTYIEKWLLISRHTVIETLKKLINKNLIIRTKESHYIANMKTIINRNNTSEENALPSEDIALVGSEDIALVGSAETAPNIYNTINNNINKEWDFNFNSNNKIISSCNNKIKEKEKEKEKESFAADLEEVFEKLWKWYPWKKDAKQSAMKYFKKNIKNKNDLALLRYALPKYVESVKDKQYLLLLRTYLCDCRHLDYSEQYNSTLNSNLTTLNTKSIKEETQETNEEFKKDFKIKYNII